MLNFCKIHDHIPWKTKFRKLKSLEKKKINRSTLISQRNNPSKIERRKNSVSLKSFKNPKKEDEVVLYSPIMAAFCHNHRAATLHATSRRHTPILSTALSHPTGLAAPLCPTIIATPSSVASRIPRGCHLTLDALLSSGVAASATFKKTSGVSPSWCTMHCSTRARVTSNQSGCAREPPDDVSDFTFDPGCLWLSNALIARPWRKGRRRGWRIEDEGEGRRFEDYRDYLGLMF